LCLIAAAGLLAVLVWPSFRRPDYVNFPPRATGPWVAFGDSLTEGYGASEGHDYPTVLGQRLGVKIVNLGVSGHTTADGLRRVEEVVALEPRVVLLCLGGNDALQGARREATFANLAGIVDRLQQQGAFVVLIGVRSASLRDKNEAWFSRLAKENRALYVPNILKGVFARPVYMSDALHPNDEGYRLIAERLEKVLRPLLPQLQGAPAAGG
jgi:lysophospholipase L1-like esterase